MNKKKLKRALAGHLFDGESLSTREAIRTELITNGLTALDQLERIKLLVKHAKNGTYAVKGRDFGRGVSFMVKELEKILDA